jgi:hypothetical protein
VSTKREPREITFSEIENSFHLASYWWGEKWCPAVASRETGSGFAIRIVKSVTLSGANESITYDYFELDAFGVITVAPWGFAKEFKPGRVVDIADAVRSYSTPDPKARRIL